MLGSWMTPSRSDPSPSAPDFKEVETFEGGRAFSRPSLTAAGLPKDAHASPTASAASAEVAANPNVRLSMPPSRAPCMRSGS
ncbi:MAG TPA: hypothetical protein VGY48_30955 [Vicinamibacterales bacterium]|nr:hypothetical protein [Vicinamibacterales bacterium]